MKQMMFVFMRAVGRFIGWFIPWQLPGLFKSFAYEITSAIYSKAFKKCGKNFHVEYPLVLTGSKYVSIGDNFCCNKRLRIEVYDKYKGETFAPEIIIGNNVGMNHNCHIAAINKIVIGNNVLMGSNILITDHYHGEITSEAIKSAPALRNLYSKGPVIIEDNVWIGEGVAIMPGVVIGANSIIGANAVITKSVAANSVVGGNPARVIKSL
jgi:acetyltransferase-like isoleucine patch superfamily enzyme